MKGNIVDFNPGMETHTQYLRRKLIKVGHWALARWMLKQGYPFNYTYFVIFNRKVS